MKVKDLIKMLKDYDMDADVVMQANGYRVLVGIEEDFYIGEIDDGPIFLGDYVDIDSMAENLGEEVVALSESLKDLVVLY